MHSTVNSFGWSAPSYSILVIMEEETNKGGSRPELETILLQKVGDTISSIKEANHVDEVICALYSLAVLLFPLDSALVSGAFNGSHFRDQIFNVTVPSTSKSDEWRHAFYRGSAFPTLARVLIYNVASSWLASFPILSRKCVYDTFFLEGPSVEVFQAVLPGMSQNGNKNDGINSKAVSSNAERILVLCLLENDGVLRMAREFGDSARFEEFCSGQLKPNDLFISRIAQQMASVPDKARLGAPAALSSQYLSFLQCF